MSRSYNLRRKNIKRFKRNPWPATARPVAFDFVAWKWKLRKAEPATWAR